MHDRRVDQDKPVSLEDKDYTDEEVMAAQAALSKGIQTVVFDRGGARYHGKVKALADAAREAGLKF